MIIINQAYNFSAAHKLRNTKWSDEKNLEVFGPCANDNWHGHNFKLIVTVKGTIDPETGYVVNRILIDSLVQELIVDKVDCKNLNLDVPFMKGQMASCENLVIGFWDILYNEMKAISNASLHKIELWETPRNYVEYYG